MTLHRSEEEVDKMIKDMISRAKGRYITQGVSFNKTCPRQLRLLKKSLMSSVSFSGLIKEMLALKFDEGENINSPSKPPEKPKNKNIGNFL